MRIACRCLLLSILDFPGISLQACAVLILLKVLCILYADLFLTSRTLMCSQEVRSILGI